MAIGVAVIRPYNLQCPGSLLNALIRLPWAAPPNQAFDAADEDRARATSNARGTSLDWRTAVFAAGRVGP